MTDIAYISAFRRNDRKAITAFYTCYQKPFFKVIANRFRLSDASLIEDVYQDSVCRLWENIRRGKLSEHNLTVSLAAYLYGIGEFVMYENLRKTKELLVTEEQLYEYNLLQTIQSQIEYDREQQYQAIRETIKTMGKPCAPLLLKFYWEELSWDKIARQLGYSNANSAKTQKNKCMNKLKSILKR